LVALGLGIGSGSPSPGQLLGLLLTTATALLAVGLAIVHIGIVSARGSQAPEAYWHVSLHMSVATLAVAVLMGPFSQKLHLVREVATAALFAMILASGLLDLNAYAWFALAVSAAFIAFVPTTRSQSLCGRLGKEKSRPVDSELGANCISDLMK
jgi:hypothetical protein